MTINLKNRARAEEAFKKPQRVQDGEKVKTVVSEPATAAESEMRDLTANPDKKG